MLASKQKIKTLLTNTLVLVFGLLASGYLSFLSGKDLGWDLANYHYYNPYAFFHTRDKLDFWPSSFIHQYLNPSIDFLSYYLINHFKPSLSEFLLGAIHGLNFWLLFLIARVFLKERFTNSLAFLLAVLGMYGPTALPGIGSFQNDNLISIFILGFVLLQIKAMQIYLLENRLALSLYSMSGLLLGIGMGLKLTASLFSLGAFLAIAILPLKFSDKVKFMMILGLSLLTGMLFSSGYWMALMWQQHHNPFFPFFNGLFHSPDFSLINWRDLRFLPQGIGQTLFFPFYFAWDGRTADQPFQDFRFPLVYLLFVLAGLHWLYSKSFGQTQPQSLSKPKIILRFWLYAFFIFSYVIWQYFFANSRYLVALEMLSPLVIYLLLRQVIKQSDAFFAVLIFVFYSLFFFMIPSKTIRAPWYESTFFNVKLPASIQQTPEALVLITYSAYAMDLNPRPQSYLIPFFPARFQFIGVPFVKASYFSDKTTSDKIESIIRGYHHKIYLLSSDENMPEFYRTARNFGLAPDGGCEHIISDRQKVTYQGVLLCAVKHLSSFNRSAVMQA